ncbi:MAG: peptidylprolyl isomerase [Acidimicrobiia bacterium]
MKKLVPILLLVALVAAACGSGSSTVTATVDGTEITDTDVESLIDVEGSIIPKDQFAQFLGFEIQWEIINTAAAEQFGIEFTDEEVIAEADRIYETANADETREEFLVNAGVTEEFLLNISRQGLLDVAVREALGSELPPLSQEAIDVEMTTAVASLTQVCVSHILVDTEPEAQDAMDRVTGGEEFAAVASEMSQDPGSADNDGILPCGSAGQYVAEFRDAALVAPIGEVHQSLVETQFGFHVMLVTDRVDPAAGDLPTEDEIVETLQAIAVAAELEIWFLEQMTTADVAVEEEFGIWQTTPEPGVIAPAE